MKLRIKKNDVVRVIAGNDKGKEGRVIDVLPEKMRVVVEGVNVRKRHTRPTAVRPEGAIIEREMPIHYSNVMILDGNNNTTRINTKLVEEGGVTKRVRVANTTGDVL
jgi:large subunit ribosomal protein L24